MMRTRDAFSCRESLNSQSQSQSVRGSGYGNIHGKYHALIENKKSLKTNKPFRDSDNCDFLSANASVGCKKRKSQGQKRVRGDTNGSNDFDKTLFELAALSPMEKQINIKKLANFLDKKGIQLLSCVTFFLFFILLQEKCNQQYVLKFKTNLLSYFLVSYLLIHSNRTEREREGEGQGGAVPSLFHHLSIIIFWYH